MESKPKASIVVDKTPILTERELKVEVGIYLLSLMDTILSVLSQANTLVYMEKRAEEILSIAEPYYVEKGRHEVIKEIERERFETPQYIAESGSTPVIICLTEGDLQALKEASKDAHIIT